MVSESSAAVFGHQDVQAAGFPVRLAKAGSQSRPLRCSFDTATGVDTSSPELWGAVPAEALSEPEAELVVLTAVARSLDRCRCPRRLQQIAWKLLRGREADPTKVAKAASGESGLATSSSCWGRPA